MFCEQITLKSGQKRWVCVADGPPDPVSGKRKQVKRRAKRKQDAIDRVRQAIREMETGGLSRENRVTTFDAIADEWFGIYSLKGLKENTLIARKKQIKILNDYMAKVDITKTNYSFYQRIIENMSKKYARNTVIGVNSTAKMIFQYAIREKIIRDNHARDVIIPRKAKTIEDIKEKDLNNSYFDRHELDVFLDTVLKDGLVLDKEVFHTLAFTGMRSGELCALQVSDLNFEDCIISINKTLFNPRNIKKEYKLIPPKTKGSAREIKVEKPIMDMLKSVAIRNSKLKLMFGKGYHGKGFLFCDNQGYPITPKFIHARMKRLMNKTDIKKSASPHIFRHTHISMLAEVKVELPTIMEKVGHENSDTTLKIYTHVTKKMKENASNLIQIEYAERFKKISN